MLMLIIYQFIKGHDRNYENWVGVKLTKVEGDLFEYSESADSIWNDLHQ